MQVAQEKPTIQLGEEGLTMIGYTGLFDLITHNGAITGAAYTVGLFRPRCYVDNRDLPALLTTQEDGLNVFVEAL